MKRFPAREGLGLRGCVSSVLDWVSEVACRAIVREAAGTYPTEDLRRFARDQEVTRQARAMVGGLLYQERVVATEVPAGLIALQNHINQQ